MQHLKGGLAPFFLSLSSPRLREEALLQYAYDAYLAGHSADALVACEYVCRRLPALNAAAMLRAKLLQDCHSEYTTDAWQHAWHSEPDKPQLQDIMLQRWLQVGQTDKIKELGPAFLPARCASGDQPSVLTLLSVLRGAGLQWLAACWKVGDTICGMVQAPPGTIGPAKVLLSDETQQFEVMVPADGSYFHLACPYPGGVWSLAVDVPGAPAQLVPGSPLAFYSPPAPAAAPAATGPRAVAIVVPVYRDLALVKACINSVLASQPLNRTPSQLVVIDDASPEPAISAWLDDLAAQGRISLLRNYRNMGFIETTNRGLRQCPNLDALLLNADTVVHGDWIDRLSAALYQAPGIASVTPWSNNGEISSFPDICKAAPSPTPQQLALFDSTAAALRAAGRTNDVELPSCCGFTMLIRRDVLDHIGLLDGSALERGYGEEVDWCQRAISAGYRHLHATGVYVAHTGTVSFKLEKKLRVRQNRKVVDARYPKYMPDFVRFLQTDPLRAARTALREALPEPAATPAPAPAAGGAGRPGPAPLPGRGARIVAWRVHPAAPQHRQLLELARLLASQAGTSLRLLVVGHASEALWHTGVVDVLPSSGDDDALLLDDHALVALGGGIAVLSDGQQGSLPALPHTVLAPTFDAPAWLAALTQNEQHHETESI